jgi:hypothetical protein
LIWGFPHVLELPHLEISKYEHHPPIRISSKGVDFL